MPHWQLVEQQQAQLPEREKEQVLRLARIAGVANPEARLSPEINATIRFGDPVYAGLLEREARAEVMEEALAKLEAEGVSLKGLDEAPIVNVQELPGVGPDLAQALEAHGFDTAEKIAFSSEDALQQVPGVGPKKAAELKEAASGQG